VSSRSDRAAAVRFDRAVGALYGLAIGDALGMPTQMMSRQEVRTRFGAIDTFESAAADHPLAAGMAAASVTDDTEQAILLARHLVAHAGHVDPAELARELVEWEESMRARGSLDLLGPSTKAAVQAVLDGTPVEEAGRFGTTNGAAMRITPVGIVVRSVDLGALVDRVVEASSVSHDTGVAIAGAAAVAAAVSAALDDGGLAEAFEAGIAAARLGSARGHWVASGDVARRIEWAISLADPAAPERSGIDIYELIGTSLATAESVPAAFGILACYPEDPWGACRAAASLGGDSDTVAAMIGAIGGACFGTSGFPADAVATIRRVNGLDLAPLAKQLLALR
jgi:ADP-ribosylglycohydrolase